MGSKKIVQLPADDLYWRWNEHIAIIADDVSFLLENRARFEAVYKLLVKNGRLDRAKSGVVLWFGRLFGSEALMLIRRELDDQAGVINLKNLLHEMEARPDVMTMARFMDTVDCRLDCCDRASRDAAYARFRGFGLVQVGPNEFSGGTDDYISPAAFAADRQELVRLTEKAFRFAQLLIAHRTPYSHLDIEIDEISAAADVIVSYVRKYYFLFNAEEVDDLDEDEKPPQTVEEWLEEFHQALVPAP